ncbi:MAG: NAD-dependent epimerase/dehydratase family protein [Pseudomonadota bacterium]
MSGNDGVRYAMLKIGITGVAGLIGWHMRAYLHSQPNCETIPADRATFANEQRLDAFVASADAIVHLAGMNRGDDTAIEQTNIALVEALVAACERGRRTPHIVFSSSTHIMGDTAYARSKRECAECFRQWAKRSGGRFTNLILPHVFGEGGKPFYNSVVSTFCHQLANGEASRVVHDGELELVHAQEVAETVLRIIRAGEVGEVRVAGVAMKVSQLLQKLVQFDAQYRAQLLPDTMAAIDLRLFNTYRSYLFPHHYPVSLKLHEDNRGALFEAIKTIPGGQCFISTTKPGVTRGNHYHTKKIERFLVLGGSGLIRVRKLFSDEVAEFAVSGTQPQYIDMPVLHTHNITNVGETEMTTLFWSNEIFDPANPDTFPEKV